MRVCVCVCVQRVRSRVCRRCVCVRVMCVRVYVCVVYVCVRASARARAGAFAVFMRVRVPRERSPCARVCV